MLRFRNLGSGSTGNATVVEAGSGVHTRRLLVDCGLGIRELDRRLALAGLLAEQIDAVFITHEHADHIGCARGFSRRHGAPVWMSAGTHAALNQPDLNGALRIAQDSTDIDLGELQVTPFTVPHDAREPLQLRCSDGAVTLGILTDLGHVTSHVIEHLQGCDAMLLECNHDAQMLASGPYPDFLKRRVAGKHGHLSNDDAVALAQAIDHAGLVHIFAAHLSQQNNRPDIVRNALSAALGRAFDDIGIAHPTDGTPWVSL